MFVYLTAFFLVCSLVACGSSAPRPANIKNMGEGNNQNKGDGRDLPDQGRPIPGKDDGSKSNFKECELFNSTFAFDQSLDAVAGKFSGQYDTFFGSRTYNATFQNRIDLSFSATDVSESSNGSLKSVDTDKATDKAKADLVKKQQALHGPKLIGVDRATIIDKTPSWGEVKCSVQALSKIEAGSGLTVEYDPAIPSMILPMLSAEQFKNEIGQGKSFPNLSAVVIAGSNEVLKNGASVAGSASIQPISPEMTFTDLNGQKISVKADVAYEVSFAFGDSKVTRALGLRPVTRYYIDTTKKSFAAIYVDWLDRNYLQPMLYRAK